VRTWFLVAALLAGCDDEMGMSPDLSVPADLTTAHQGVLLTVADRAIPLQAWYSIFIEPLEATNPGAADLVVTFIDPAFDCAGKVTTGLDAISFQFLARVNGVTSNFVLGRAGPDLGQLMGGGVGGAELDNVDDRFQSWDVDGGTITVAPGGLVSGAVHWTNANVTVDGMFEAPHCAQLDFAAAP
jgi:hypothetical protein